MLQTANSKQQTAKTLHSWRCFGLFSHRSIEKRPLTSYLLPLTSNQQSGFTLIELLTVISIMGLLTVVITVNLSSARKQARDVRRKMDLGTIQTAVEFYANVNGGRVPAANAQVTSAAAQPWIPDPSGGLQSYVSNLPIDPVMPNVAPYVYTYQTNPVCAATGAAANTIYAFDAVLEDEKPANVNLAATPPADPCATGFAVTGTYAVGTVVHYRVGSGGR